MDVAIVGCGHMGRLHARVVAGTPGCRVVALIDADAEPAVRLAAEVDGEPRSDIPDGVDAVIVASPATTHAAWVARAVVDGRWCLVEKPLVASSVDTHLVRCPRVVVGHSERFNPALRGGVGGGVTRMRSRRYGRATPRGRDVDVCLDLLVHDLDLALHWLGPPAEVRWARGGGGQGLDEVEAVVRFVRGGEVHLAVSRHAEAPERRVDLLSGDVWRSYDLTAGWGGGPDPLTRQWRAFLDAVKGRRAPEVDAEHGLAVVSLAEQVARIAATSGQPPVERGPLLGVGPHRPDLSEPLDRLA